MTILVLAEHTHQHLGAATANVVAAALALGDEVHVLVAGTDCQAAAEQARELAGVSRVLLVDAPHYRDQLAENLAALILAHAPGYEHILAAASPAGKSTLPRVAALLGVAQISDVIAVEDSATFVRPIYAGNALARVRSTDAVKVMTIRTTAFDAVASGAVVPVETLPAGPDLGLSRLVSRALTVSERPELGAADIIVSGGRGLGSGEHYRQVLEPLADRLGAALGASRAAVDAGFVPNDYQVGQTGKIVAPQLYIAVGISGAIQHLAGMKDSKVIVAVNKDPEAPIFGVADYGLEADLFTAVPELVQALQPA
ncbi:electron transfer flavoprotein subunit alpha/FixB family protein [Castellaniella caeni]|uniref:electron transfer flavoprotein subunit alpha/FixB family protein n=1 Tax=Castellaniella caeni TaxID=266123 RepID=UPI00082D2B94|nr:FAD-binding protein [Castellaniella caeni]